VTSAKALANVQSVVVRNLALILGVALGCAFSACGGSSESSDGSGDGNGGTGGTAPNTCPPTLVNYGSGPGIICQDTTGDQCADGEQFCVCGEETIEGRPWICVPTHDGCPFPFPDGEACDSTAPESCDYLTDVRVTCTCNSDTWLCEPSACGQAYPGDGTPCTLDPGDTCRFFLPATPGDPDNAPNLTCACEADQTWSCPPLPAGAR
jgi:hypothetical protein